MQGLRLDIYRGPYGDCSAGGISGRCKNVTLIGTLDLRNGGEQRMNRQWRAANIEPLTGDSRGPFEVTDEAPAVVMVYRKPINGRPLVHVEPLEWPEGSWSMAGGTYVHGDSRFSDLAGFYGAVAFHDRFEH